MHIMYTCKGFLQIGILDIFTKVQYRKYFMSGRFTNTTINLVFQQINLRIFYFFRSPKNN